MSSIGDACERFLDTAGFDRAPWLAVAFAGGIASWFVLDESFQWVLAISAALFLALGAVALWRGRDDRGRLLIACVSLGLIFAAGVGVVWARSELVGAQPLDRPISASFDARILERVEQPAQDRVRLILATRHPETSAAIKIRVNLPTDGDRAELGEGALVRLRARLMPPAPPMLPGAYNFARSAWFDGYAATGSVQGEVELLEPGSNGGLIAPLQRQLSRHVRSRLDGAPGAIAAAFASGDRGAIGDEDAEAMRDAGLTHLLAISGLHVSAVIAATYLLAIRLLALWPWLTLRVRLPVTAAALAALAGIGYTLLTGAQVPTVRSCVAAMLVLGALAMGREALSLRMVAVAAVVVLLLWPESIIGPSFQMSFAAVLAIVALHGCDPVRKFLASREESWFAHAGRRVVMLLVTGMVIEIALMPIVLFHFHRAGLYGALANVIAIPLVTFISMPLIAISLALDSAGLGAPFWWLTGKSLDLLLGIAHFTAGQPGAVKLMPQMSTGTFALFLSGGLWLAMWKGRARLWGLVPAALASMLMLSTPIPDLLISGDGRHVGITGENDGLLVLRDSRSDYARDNLMQLSGVTAEPTVLTQWQGADCSRDFCVITLARGGRDWHVLMSRSGEIVSERALAAACERADIVISDRWLPRSCQPRWFIADRNSLEQSGGLAVNLEKAQVSSVAESQGDHGWWGGRTGD
ncbi:ComEC/Rec2 family competence protein [Alteraurantiacibacter aestuarii]